MVILLLGTHIFLTLRTGFIQRKSFLPVLSFRLLKTPSKDGDVSPFQALTTALASTIGTGNIVGVGTAIFFGALVQYSGAGLQVYLVLLQSRRISYFY